MTEDVLSPFKPTPHDVICTRKKKWCDRHAGNLEYHRLLESFRPRMTRRNDCPKAEEVKSMAHEIWEQISQNNNGRFLKPDSINENYCVVLTRHASLQKIEMALRALRLPTTKQLPVVLAKRTYTKRKTMTMDAAAAAAAATATATATATPGTTTATEGRRRGRPPKNKMQQNQNSIAPVLARPNVIVKDNDDSSDDDGDDDDDDEDDDDDDDNQKEQCSNDLNFDDDDDDDDDKTLDFTTPRAPPAAAAAITTKTAALSSAVASDGITSQQPPIPVPVVSMLPTLVATTPVAAVIPSRNAAVGNWTYDRLYRSGPRPTGVAAGAAAAATTVSQQVQRLYGSPQDEIHMRRWLNDHKLPQSVGDLFLSLGARDVDDAILLFETTPTKLHSLATLDMLKLKKAVQSSKVVAIKRRASSDGLLRITSHNTKKNKSNKHNNNHNNNNNNNNNDVHYV